MQLQQLLSSEGIVALRTYITEQSKTGKKKSPAGEWGYTKEFLSTYTELDLDTLIALFTAEGITNELDATKTLWRFDKLID